MRNELEAGLGFLAKTYNFTVRPYDEGPGKWAVTRARDPDFFYGPSGHALSFKARILWLDEGNAHAEWMHEAAHLVCSPPWEESPDHADEFGGIFGWERAVGKEFLRQKLWTEKDFEKLLHVQDIYGVGDDLPREWFGVEGFCEWQSVPPDAQDTIVRFINGTLRMAGLLNAKNRPTWKQPVWNDKIRARWEATANFKNGWPLISKMGGRTS